MGSVWMGEGWVVGGWIVWIGDGCAVGGWVVCGYVMDVWWMDG